MSESLSDPQNDAQIVIHTLTLSYVIAIHYPEDFGLILASELLPIVVMSQLQVEDPISSYGTKQAQFEGCP